ncbi:monoamine oxidase [Nitrosospira sp. Nsp5]|uniref:Monoamine oxidase n=1 Tax=Nitrosospira multiformis TaxID=1231 RepID=A0ABY0T6H9_9PROT|nr:MULTISPECIES: FAD-dependent oxidoreductase [Nitrosospira]PTR07096.1 monoamine oxidase [Nitrosospira sp. Nsp5]SDQ33463.1 monoamine oxidase [Nitrosospira multiformis]
MMRTYPYFLPTPGRTPLFRLLSRTFNQHRYFSQVNIINQGKKSEHFSHFGSRRNFLIRSIAALATVYAAPIMAGEKKGNPRIAIVGAGIAGLTAAYVLQRKGYHATVYEASQRTGGRIWTSQDGIVSGLVTELGGEFIDSSHQDMLALAKAFDLPLIDTYTESEQDFKTAFFFGNRHYSEEQVINEFRPLAAIIASDAARLSSDITAKKHSKIDAEFDAVSISEYLDRIGATGWVRNLIEVAYVTEYGLDASELSCINLLSLIDTDMKEGFQIFGESDERFKIQGGNQRITDELAKRIGSNIALEHRLVSMRKNGKGFRLTFTTPGKTVSVDADRVILALPFTLLRNVDTGNVLTPAESNMVKNLGYGTNAKLILGTQTRLWREQRYSGECYSDEAFQTGWDSSRMQAGIAGSYTFFLGGKPGVDIGRGTPAERAQQLSASINRVYPGLAAQLTNNTLRVHWPSEPFALGSYSCYRPRQWTRFNGEVGRPNGNLLYAGEHCSTQFLGYMNGGAETGRLAAQAIIDLP